MARIPLRGGFTVIPEGHYIFKVTAVEYKEEFGKLNVTLETEAGEKHIERFSLLNANNEPNDKAMAAFSIFAKNVLNDFKVDEIDEKDLIGHYLECDVEHDIRQSTKDPSKNVTFVHLNNYSPVEGVVKEAPKPEPKKDDKLDLDDLFGF